MRAVVQRVKNCIVHIEGKKQSSIPEGLLAYIGIKSDDSKEDIRYIADKIINLRIFEDTNGKMNRSVIDEGKSIIVISQFTLYGDTRKGRRPSYNHAAPPETAEQLYFFFLEYLRNICPLKIETGQFQEYMEITSTNCGPVTILIDSKKEF